MRRKAYLTLSLSPVSAPSLLSNPHHLLFFSLSHLSFTPYCGEFSRPLGASLHFVSRFLFLWCGSVLHGAIPRALRLMSSMFAQDKVQDAIYEDALPQIMHHNTSRNPNGMLRHDLCRFGRRALDIRMGKLNVIGASPTAICPACNIAW